MGTPLQGPFFLVLVAPMTSKCHKTSRQNYIQVSRNVMVSRDVKMSRDVMVRYDVTKARASVPRGVTLVSVTSMFHAVTVSRDIMVSRDVTVASSTTS